MYTRSTILVSSEKEIDDMGRVDNTYSNGARCSMRPVPEKFAGLQSMKLQNTTHLATLRLASMFESAIAGWPSDGLTVKVRYSRGADFSGTCFYRDQLIHINLGRHLSYPYLMQTYVGKALTTRRRWWKPTCRIQLENGYQLALFVFLHEFYHWLVKKANRNTRQKESMCDRFAARLLVDRYGARIVDDQGVDVPRAAWDFQDVEAFVDAAKRRARLMTGADSANVELRA